MEKVASIIKYRNSEKIIEWLEKLPRKLSLDDVQKLLKVAKNAKYLLWTEKHGVKLLK